jgi:hypothetical protein
LFEEVLVLFDCVLSNGIQGGFLGGFNVFPGIVKKKSFKLCVRDSFPEFSRK